MGLKKCSFSYLIENKKGYTKKKHNITCIKGKKNTHPFIELLASKLKIKKKYNKKRTEKEQRMWD